jgi:hypothetical protein
MTIYRTGATDTPTKTEKSGQSHQGGKKIYFWIFGLKIELPVTS